MNSQSYGGIQWMQHHAPSGMKASNQLLTHSQVSEIVEVNDDDDCNDDYLVNDDAEAALDQMAAENLIFMARDGQMVSEIIRAHENDAVVVTAGDGTPNEIEEATALTQMDAYSVVYTEDTPQMVTEEVITDDWVQHQGEERVEISADQILGSNNSQVLLDMEVPLPTVQDEYTALRPYPCDFCSRRFRKKASLMTHMVAHQNDRPHLCKLCGARYARRSELINHFKAHAESADVEQDGDTNCNYDTQFETQTRTLNDHYYDQEWQWQSEFADSNQLRHNKSSRKLQMNNISGNSSSSTFPTTTASLATSSRGRISRLKPKEEVQYIVNNDDEKQVPADLEYLECQNLQASTAAVKLTQDQSPAHQQHYPIIDDSKPFVCQQCGLAFAREKALHSHIKSHRLDAPYECNHCNEMFWDTNSLQDHQKTHQFEESNSEYDPAEAEDTQSESESEQLYGEFYCNECGISFHRQDLLRRHAKQHMKNTPGRQAIEQNSTTAAVDHALTSATEHANDDAQHCCSTCGETFVEALDLLAHAEIHARFPPFKCVLCGESFYEEQTIKRHLQSRHSHEMTPNSCILCGKECRDRKALIKHAWDHSREKCHSCSKCGKNFHNKARLKRHMASHRDKSVMCDVCHEEFPDGRTLSNHRHSHSTTSAGKLFPCNECGKTFGSRSSQQIHVRIHTGERPYGCRFCWKAFADGGTLRKHERIHTGEKPYACSVCPRAFNQRVVLREHIRSHHSGIDSNRGLFFCTVCEAEMATSNELIQHLIQHSDTNTAKQRQPVTGPRKYKRRRKLQPHEIAHLRRESIHYEEDDDGETDIDISDFDMENVDDLLGITENENLSTAKKNGAILTNATKDQINCITSSNRKRNKKSDSNRSNHLSKMDDGTTAGGRDSAATRRRHREQANELTVNSAHITNNNNKQRYDSTSSSPDKLWDIKLLSSGSSIGHNRRNSNDESYKSLMEHLEHLEHGLHSIDALVENNDLNSLKIRRTKQIINDVSSSGGAQRTKQVQLNNNKVDFNQTCNIKDTTATVSSSKAKRKLPNKGRKSNPVGRPRMIHTEKLKPAQDISNSSSQKKSRTKTYISRTETTNLDLLHTKSTTSSTIVDDYEIISPATQPPNQISSSPLHIKQENEHHQNQLQQMYDAQLLLDASNLRKETYEKFNPSSVNDLEDILRSPLKSEKHLRQRFISESSTVHQFLAEEDQNIIKIEPTSPDLHEIVEGHHQRSQRQQSATSVPSSPSLLTQTAARRTRTRQVTANYKYLIDTTPTVPAKPMKRGKMKLPEKPNKKLNNSVGDSSSTNDCVYKSTRNTSYLSYGMNSYNNNITVPAGPSNADVNSTYFSISAVVSAADANEAATAAAAAAAKCASTHPVRVFECEMCSAVFSDRAQLLEHVHIHI